MAFRALLEQNSSEYRKDRLLIKQIKKVFADGITMKDTKEELQTRRDAYCLSLGISLDFLEQHQTAFYQKLLD